MNINQRIAYIKSLLVRANDAATRSALESALAQAQAAQSATRTAGDVSVRHEAERDYRAQVLMSATKVMFL